jgi:DNA replication and repair protein RecF
MVHWGAQILRQRQTMLHEVARRAAPIFADLAGVSETLGITYRSTVCGPNNGQTLQAELAQSFREQQERVAAREIEQAVSLVGPHRDDFGFSLDTVDLNTYGSRGQQRLAVLALKLAEADWMRAQIGDLPVILLDDVLSELDPQRRQYVTDRVVRADSSDDRQVWVTTTDVHGFSDEILTSAQQFEIDAGHVRRA